MFTKKFTVGLLVILLALGLVGPAYAQGDEPAPEPVEEEVEVVEEAPAEGAPAALAWLDELLGFVPSVLQVAGVGGIVGFFIDVLKLTGRMKDGYATRISLIVNFAVWAVLWFGARFGHEQEVREAIVSLGVALPALLTLFGMLGGAKLAHAFMKWIDAATFSVTERTLRAAQEKAAIQPGSFRPGTAG